MAAQEAEVVSLSEILHSSNNNYTALHEKALFNRKISMQLGNPGVVGRPADLLKRFQCYSSTNCLLKSPATLRLFRKFSPSLSFPEFPALIFAFVQAPWKCCTVNGRARACALTPHLHYLPPVFGEKAINRSLHLVAA